MEKLCTVCGCSYKPTSNRQKYCPVCSIEVHHGQLQKYHAENKEHETDYKNTWRTLNLEHARATQRAYYALNSEHISVHNRKWDAEHAEQKRLGEKQWIRRNRTRRNETSKTWDHDHPEQHREIQGRMKAKRRTLGFSPLNNPFPGCEGHHLDEEIVVYIPKELHRSVSHNLWHKRGMRTINALALGWFMKQGA